MYCSRFDFGTPIVVLNENSFDMEPLKKLHLRDMPSNKGIDRLIRCRGFVNELPDVGYCAVT